MEKNRKAGVVDGPEYQVVETSLRAGREEPEEELSEIAS